MTDKDEIAALKARVAELEAKAKPPPPMPERFERWDPSAGLSMPRSAMLEMANAVPDHVMKDVVRDNRAPQGPSSAGTSGTISKVHQSPGLPGTQSGWVESRPLDPVPGLQHIENIGNAFAQRDRAELIEREAKRVRIARVEEKP
jgi:hypothetical protein